MMDFAEFKASDPARSMFRRLRMTNILEASEDWRSLQYNVVKFNDWAHGNGHFVDRVRANAGVCSSGERVLLKAIAYVCDFAWLADELDADEDEKCGRSWRAMSSASGEFRACVAACIAAQA